MTQIEKLLRQFSTRPEKIPLRDIEKILFHVGFVRISTKGSHRKYASSYAGSDIIIPVHNNECKAFYKKLVLKKIKELL